MDALPAIRSIDVGRFAGKAATWTCGRFTSADHVPRDKPAITMPSHTDCAAVEADIAAEQEIEMNADLKMFALQWLRVAVMALIPVVFTAFVGMPYAIGGHPGEAFARAGHADRHMT